MLFQTDTHLSPSQLLWIDMHQIILQCILTTPVYCAEGLHFSAFIKLWAIGLVTSNTLCLLIMIVISENNITTDNLNYFGIIILGKMWMDLREGHTVAQFLFLITHNFKTVTVMDLKPGIAILQSLHYTRCKFHVLSTSGLGVAIANATCDKKSAILCLTLEPHHFR